MRLLWASVALVLLFGLASYMYAFAAPVTGFATLPITGYEVAEDERSIPSSLTVYVDNTAPSIVVRNAWAETLATGTPSYISMNGRSRFFITVSDIGSGLREVSVTCPGVDDITEEFKGKTKSWSTICETDILIGTAPSLTVTATDWVGNPASFTKTLTSKQCVAKADHNVKDSTYEDESILWPLELQGSNDVMCHRVAVRAKAGTRDCNKKMEYRFAETHKIKYSCEHPDNGQRYPKNVPNACFGYASSWHKIGDDKIDGDEWSAKTDPSDWNWWPNKVDGVGNNKFASDPFHVYVFQTYCKDAYAFGDPGELADVDYGCWVAEPWGDYKIVEEFKKDLFGEGAEMNNIIISRALDIDSIPSRDTYLKNCAPSATSTALSMKYERVTIGDYDDEWETWPHDEDGKYDYLYEYKLVSPY